MKLQAKLGWLVVCLSVGDLKRSLEFYSLLDFVQVGGSVADDWAVIQQRNCELHLFGGKHIKQDMLNFRGGDVQAIVAELKERGLTPRAGHVDSDGMAIESPDGCMSASYFDPDGLEVFFDSHPDEQAAFTRGEPFTITGARGKVSPAALKLGNFAYSIFVGKLEPSLKFYEQLGFWMAGGKVEEKWAALAYAGPPHHPEQEVDYMHVSLHEHGGVPNILNWRGGDVFKLAEQLKARGVVFTKEPYQEYGCDTVLFEDPDGRTLMLDTHEQERLYSPRPALEQG